MKKNLGFLFVVIFSIFSVNSFAKICEVFNKTYPLIAHDGEFTKVGYLDSQNNSIGLYNMITGEDKILVNFDNYKLPHNFNLVEMSFIGNDDILLTGSPGPSYIVIDGKIGGIKDTIQNIAKRAGGAGVEISTYATKSGRFIASSYRSAFGSRQVVSIFDMKDRSNVKTIKIQGLGYNTTPLLTEDGKTLYVSTSAAGRGNRGRIDLYNLKDDSHIPLRGNTSFESKISLYGKNLVVHDRCESFDPSGQLVFKNSDCNITFMPFSKSFKYQMDNGNYYITIENTETSKKVYAEQKYWFKNRSSDIRFSESESTFLVFSYDRNTKENGYFVHDSNTGKVVRKLTCSKKSS